MKLFKKLIPFVSIASCIAVVAPMATSCNKGVSIEHDYSKGGYDFTIDKPSYRETESVILDKYFADINQNKKIFCQDYLATGIWGIILTGNEEGSMKVTVNSVNQKEHRISFKLEITTNTLGTDPIKIQYTAKNVIFTCYLDTTILGNTSWCIYPNDTELKNDSNWSIENNFNGEKTTVNKSNMINYPLIIGEGKIDSSKYLANCEKVGE